MSTAERLFTVALLVAVLALLHWGGAWLLTPVGLSVAAPVLVGTRVLFLIEKRRRDEPDTH